MTARQAMNIVSERVSVRNRLSLIFYHLPWENLLFNLPTSLEEMAKLTFFFITDKGMTAFFCCCEEKRLFCSCYSRKMF